MSYSPGLVVVDVVTMSALWFPGKLRHGFRWIRRYLLPRRHLN